MILKWKTQEKVTTFRKKVNKLASVFLSDYTPEGCRWIKDAVSKLNSSDHLFFLNRGLQFPPEYIQEMIEKLENAKVLEVEDLGDGPDLVVFVGQKIDSVCGEDEPPAVCFVDNKAIEFILLEGLQEKYKVYSGKALNRIRQSINKDRGAPQKTTADDMDGLFNDIADADEDVHITKNDDKTTKDEDPHPHNEKTHHRDESEDDKDRGTSRRTRSRETDRGDRNAGKKGGEGKTSRRDEINKSKDPKGKADKKSGDNADDNESLHDIEKRIFAETEEKTMIGESFSKLDEAKVIFISALFDRTKKNIMKYVRSKDNDEDIDDETIVNFIVFMSKIEKYEDFDKNWKIAGNGKLVISLSEEEFHNLRKEIMYYSEACETVYEKDKWDF